MKGRERDLVLLFAILILAVVALWVDWPGNPGLHLSFGPLKVDREIKLHRGLDLGGGLRVLLEAKMGAEERVSREEMVAAKGIIERRIDSLGISEPIIQLLGADKILVEIPEVKDPELAIKTFGRRGLLEFIDVGYTPPAQGTRVRTTYEALGGGTGLTGTVGISPTVAPATSTPSIALSPAVTVTTPAPLSPTVTPEGEGKIFTPVLTQEHLKSARVFFREEGWSQVSFTLNPEGAEILEEHTRTHMGQFMAIAMDGEIISSPKIDSVIRDQIGFPARLSLAQAQSLDIQLKYGALPVPLEVAEKRRVGPTLGQESVRKSTMAGEIGLSMVALFILLYYRLPGLLADLALGIYGALVLALLKLIPLVLTLSGVAGLILSMGIALDANILIFERMKEELRAGSELRQAVKVGFSRAWPSILYPNIATIIICLILVTFGEGILKGFALTLLIGVVVSMFMAIVVTRTFLRFTMEFFFRELDGERETRLRALIGY